MLPRTNASLSRLPSPTTSTVISFPQTITATTRPTATPSLPPTATTSSPTNTNSNYNYLTTLSALLLNTASPTTASPTISNPDQAPTTISLLSVAPTAVPTAPPLPSGLPQMILPNPPLDVNSLPSTLTMINILFNASLNWEFVAQNADSPGQIFEYFPTVIATALGIDGTSFKSVPDRPRT